MGVERTRGETAAEVAPSLPHSYPETEAVMQGRPTEYNVCICTEEPFSMYICSLITAYQNEIMLQNWGT